MTNEKIEKAKSFFEKAKKAYERQDYRVSRNNIEKAIKYNPDYFEAYHNLGLILLNHYSKEYKKARECLEKTIKLNPNYVDAYNNLAILLVTDFFKEYEQAKENYEKAIELNPKFAEAYNNLAILLATDFFKEYEQAKEYYEKAIKLNPNYAHAHHNLALLLFLFEDFKDNEKAQFHFLKTIELLIKQNRNTEFTRSVFRESFKDLLKDIFISDFQIHKVRHLENINIPLDKTELKHLILTGDNGSGKTSVLEACKNYLQSLLELPIPELFSEKGKKMYLEQADAPLHLTFTESLLTFRLKYEIGHFTLKYFPTHKEKFSLDPIQKIKKVNFPLITPLETTDKLNKELIYYLVDLDYIHARSFRNQRSIDDKTKEEGIRLWFEQFENVMKKIDHRIEYMQVRSDDEGYTFEFIPKPPHEPFTFAQLSGGYSAVFDIATELILECTAKKLPFDELQGIVLIDEPEVHLHIKMQKRLLPLLTELFPKVQFIVASHSAFILNSLENAVVYDLQNRQRLTDISDISPSRLNQYYFSFSPQKIKNIEDKIQSFIKLVKLEKEEKITEEEEKKLNDLDIELDIIIPYVDDNLFKLFKENQKYLYEL